MPNNPLTEQELYDYGILRSLTPPAEVVGRLSPPYFPAGYFLVPPHDVDGPVLWRKFNAGYISEGIIDPNRLGTGVVGDGNLYLADDGTWKPVSSGGGSQNLQEVTDLGNVTTNTIETAGTKSDYFLLDTTATPTLQPGMFGWNDAFGTADLRLKGDNVTLQVGQEIIARVVNKTGADLLESEYKVVRVRIASEGGAQGQRLAVVLAQGDNDPDSVTTLGIVTETILDNQEGFITILGNVSNIDTTGTLQGETWVDGDVLYLSPTSPGGLTKVPPVSPNHTVTIGYVVYAHQNQGKIFVKVDNGYELDELHNVLINSAANNDLLQYNSVQGVWKNVSPSLAVPTPTLDQVTTAGNTTTNTVSVGKLFVNTTTDAGYKLDVNGTIRSNNVITALGGTSTDWNSAFSWGNHATAGYLTSQPWVISGSNIYYTAGNVGIGTTTPSHFLHIYRNLSMGPITTHNVANAGFRVEDSGASMYFDGNSISLNNDSYITTSGSNFLDFGTNSTTRIRVSGSGNVLIGTTTDGPYKLDINGNLRTSADAHFAIGSGRVGIGTASPLELLHVAGAALNSYVAGVIENTVSGAADFDYKNPTQVWKMGVNVSNLFRIRDHSLGNNVVTIAAGAPANSLVILATSGNVGIGTASPTWNLDIRGSINIQGTDVKARIASFVGGDASLQLGIAGQQDWLLGVDDSDGRKFKIDSTYLGVGQATRFAIAPSTGNVLIGTSTDAGYRLDVNGNTRISGTIEAVGGTSSDWNQAYLWGDHSTAGYLQSGVGWNGTIMIPVNPPGMQNIDVVDGLIMNVF